MRETDVLIIGCGPTGATLANLLGTEGVRTLVLEKEPTQYPLPRAVHFDDETMRVFQTVGISEALLEKVRVNPGMRFVDSGGDLLLDWPRPAELSDQGWHPSYRFHQPDVEVLLRERLADYASVDLKLSAEVLEVQHGKDHCDVRWAHRSAAGDSVEVTARARYVIGCDGANSLLRNALDIQWIDLGFKERWLVVDVLLRKERPDLGDVTIQHCNPDRPITYVRCPENRRRWEIAIHDNETTDAINSPARIWPLLSRWVTPKDAEIERSAVYTFQSTLAEHWRQERCLLAGDAAHLTPPFMGQGLCGGIRDAYNLGWKISQCIRRGHRDDLLDSYQAERYPHMQVFIETAMTLGSLINVAGTREALQSALLNPDGTAKMKSPKPRLGEGLSAGVGTHRGTLCSQPIINHRLLDDIVGYAPVVLVDSELASSVSMPQMHGGPEIIESTADASISTLLATLNTKAVFIRPDRYILGTAKTDNDLAALLRVPW